MIMCLVIKEYRKWFNCLVVSRVIIYLVKVWCLKCKRVDGYYIKGSFMWRVVDFILEDLVCYI